MDQEREDLVAFMEAVIRARERIARPPRARRPAS
jgi:hypothetical protein